MAIDPSWDNFTNKLLPVRRVDRLIVWNELMKQQAIELHGYRARRDPRRRHAAVGSATSSDGVTVSREDVLPAHRRGSGDRSW